MIFFKKPDFKTVFARALEQAAPALISQANLGVQLKLRYCLAVPEDAAKIAALELASCLYENRSDPLNISLKDFTGIWRSRLKGSFTAILAFEGEYLAGFIAFKGQPRMGFIGALYVAPRFFRRAVGRRLMILSEAFVRELSGRSLSLEVQPLNIGAIAFYESLSFRRQAVKSSHLILFKKELV